jgi:hypothetical protein
VPGQQCLPSLNLEVGSRIIHDPNHPDSHEVSMPHKPFHKPFIWSQCGCVARSVLVRNLDLVHFHHIIRHLSAEKSSSGGVNSAAWEFKIILMMLISHPCLLSSFIHSSSSSCLLVSDNTTWIAKLLGSSRENAIHTWLQGCFVFWSVCVWRFVITSRKPSTPCAISVHTQDTELRQGCPSPSSFD